LTAFISLKLFICHRGTNGNNFVVLTIQNCKSLQFLLADWKISLTKTSASGR
jgi:hypothetical protein